MTAIVESKIKPGYKETEVGVIPDEWDVKIFGECFKHLKAYTFSRNQLNYVEKEDAVYNIHYGDIHSTFPRNLLDVKKDIDLIPIIISSELEAPELLKDGDLIMADASEDYKGIGQSIELINVGDKKIISGTHTFPLRPIEQFAPKYAGYIFSSYNTHKEIKRIATGISVYGISKSNIAKIKLPIPPLPEQKAIADCLSTWDKGIEKLSALIASKKEQKKGLMQGIFNGKLKVENGELVKIEDEKLWLKGWKEIKLKKTAKFLRGKGLSKGAVIQNGKNKCILYGELYTKYNEIISKIYSRTDSTDGLPSKKYDILIPSSTTTSGIDLITASCVLENNVLLGGDLIVMRPDLNKINAKFFVYLFSNSLHKLILRYTQGVTIIHLYGKDLKEVKLNLPAIEEQAAIAEVLITADKEIELLEKKLESFKTQKKGLMQVLLTGERRLV